HGGAAGVGHRRRAPGLGAQRADTRRGPLARVRPRAVRGHAVAALRLVAAHRDEVEAIRARLEGAHDLRGDADDVPLPNVVNLVVEADAAGAAHHDVRLLLLAVAVTARVAHVRRVGEATDAELAGPEVLAAEPTFQAGDPAADGVVDGEQVYDGVVGHPRALLSTLWACTHLDKSRANARPPCRPSTSTTVTPSHSSASASFRSLPATPPKPSRRPSRSATGIPTPRRCTATSAASARRFAPSASTEARSSSRASSTTASTAPTTRAPRST